MKMFKVIFLAVIALAFSACDSMGGTKGYPVSAEQMVNTIWKIKYESSSYGYIEYELVFQDGGKLVNTHPNDTTPDNDRWRVANNRVFIMFNNSYAVYEGLMSEDGKHLKGVAKNVTGKTWPWVADKLE